MPAPQKEAPAAPQKGTMAAQPPTTGRKAWRKKTPVEVFFDQEEKLRREITEIEVDLKQKRTQLQKFEQARKLFEGS